MLSPTNKSRRTIAEVLTVIVQSITAGETHIGEVGYSAITVVQQPTITAGVYVAGDAVGGLLTFANAARVNGGTGRIESVIVVDDAMQNAAFDLVLFDQIFANTADNAPFDPTDADLENCIGTIPVEVVDYASFVDNSVATVRDEPLAFTAAATSLFGQLKTRSAPTYVATSDLTIKIVVSRD